MQEVAGPSPRQTIDNFLRITEEAEAELRGALQLGMAQPGPFFSRDVYARVDQGEELLQLATQALDLSQIPPALRPMTGVGTMLQLRSLLRIEIAESPDLQLPDAAAIQRDHLQVWRLPNSSILLQAISQAQALAGKACSHCSPGDFLFSRQTLKHVPGDFDAIFAGKPQLQRQYGADLYTFWALIPGGAIPPKWFFLLSRPARRLLLTPLAGQSLLQWLLLVPVTLGLLALMGWWLLRIRLWYQSWHAAAGRWRHFLGVLAVLPLLGLLAFWQWYAIEWINLIGQRQEAVLLGSSLISGLLNALLLYLAAEASGQAICIRRRRDGDGVWLQERRKGSGQILTIARMVGLMGVVLVLVRTAQDLGLTALTLLGLASVPALAISLGTQQLIRDISDGFSLLLDGQIKLGDHCTIVTPGCTVIMPGAGSAIELQDSGEIRGVILSLGMRSVRLEQPDGSVLSLPNSVVASSVVTNHRFRTSQPMKINLPVRDAQGPAVQELLNQARALLEEIPELIDPQAELEQGASGWQLKLAGRWRGDVSRDDLAAARESLHLNLMRLLHQSAWEPAAEIDDPEPASGSG